MNTNSKEDNHKIIHLIVYRNKMKQFVKVYRNEELWGRTPGREHQGFPRFTYTEAGIRQEGMLQKLAALSRTLDRDRYVLEVAGYVKP